MSYFRRYERKVLAALDSRRAAELRVWSEQHAKLFDLRYTRFTPARSWLIHAPTAGCGRIPKRWRSGCTDLWRQAP